MDALAEKVADADAILVATASPVPVIMKEHITGSGSKLIIDFSIPCNVAPETASLPNVKLIGVDELSRIKDNTLLKRYAEIPRVEAIISEHIDAFVEWRRDRRHVPILHAVKSTLYSLHEGDQDDATHRRIQKVVNGVAVKMRTQNLPGCHYIEAINDFISPVLPNP
jgi:glutamyl-tRNA reductase